MSKKRQFLSLVALIAALLLIATACGDDSDSNASDQPAATTQAPPDDDTDTPTAEPPVQDPPDSGEGVDRSAELLGRWEVISYVLPDSGSFTNVVGAEPVFIEFAADGTILYNTGCNGGDTRYSTSGVYVVPESALDDTPEGQAITIGPEFTQTERGCEGFLGDQDVDLPANMAAATRFRLREGNLLLLDEFTLIEATSSN